MIDISKKYKTRDGCSVEGLHIKTTNSAGRKVTFPLKGNVVIQKVYRKLHYCIWTEKGTFHVIDKKHDWDLIEQ
jgi:hypothetical protein